MRSTTDRDSHARPTGAWLLQQHRLFIARHAARLGRGVAEDLASEAIARSLRHPAPDGRHGPWLERVFHNLMVDHLRRGARSRRSPSVDGPIAAIAAIAAMTDSPEQRAAEHQLRRRLATVWPRLRPEWQDALASSFGESDRTRTAAAAGLSPTTVRTRTFRALRVLRRALGVARGWLPLPLGAQLQPLAAGLLPAAIAVTTLMSPAALPGGTQLAAQTPGALVQVVPRRLSPAPVSVTPAPAPDRAPARARPSSPAHPPAPDSPPKAVARFDFDNDEVIGDLQRPDGVIVEGAPSPADHRSLIEIPGSFVAALRKTLEDL